MPQATSRQQVVGRIEDFDLASGSPLERLLFNNRRVVVVICAIVTLVLAVAATRLHLNASFEKTLPTRQTYIKNYLAHIQDLAGLGNSVRIVVEAKNGTIYDRDYLTMLQKINDEVFLLPGVDRNAMKSLWTPNVRWVGVTEDGLAGGPVVASTFDGSPKAVTEVRANVERSGEIGQTVAADAHSSIISVPLLATDQTTQKPLDYTTFTNGLHAIRERYTTSKIGFHITGFAEVVGDLINGMHSILGFFTISVAVATLFLFWYTRCLRSTFLVVSCSLVAVIWQLGFVTLLGFDLNPYSILVPFLVFAIGMSHGAQKMNGIMQDIGRGTHRLVAARYTFRRLFVAGLTAIVCDAVGFAVLMVIQIRIIQDLALIAGIGVAILVFTNLMLLPVLLSYVGVDPKAAERSLREETVGESQPSRHLVWRTLDLFTRRNYATGALVVAAALAMGGALVATHLTIGDLDPGAPELRADSVYNHDASYVTAHYGASSDVFAVMVTTPPNACTGYDTLTKEDALAWRLRQLPGVAATNSLASVSRRVLVALNEGSLDWYELLENQRVINMIAGGNVPAGLYDDNCDLLTLYAFLNDHRAGTLTRVVNEVNAFAAANDSPKAQFVLAAGSAGIEAATNIVVEQANNEMLLLVYAAVIILCLVTFRSWRAVVCAVIPLALTSILAEALMVWLHIGVKVATLPVIALGVGIGVDYSLYVMSIVLARLNEGLSLSEAYYNALLFTGRVVLLTGVTLAVGVATWAFSPIKFQADMGVLLAFMFLLNMVGALILLPSLAYFLLRPKREVSTQQIVEVRIPRRVEVRGD